MDEQSNPYICPKCKEPGIKDLPVDAKWYPNGPSFSFFPYPVIDPARSSGSDCNECGDNCYGHYVTNVDKLLLMHNAGNAIRAEPPSCILEKFFNEKGSIMSIEEEEIMNLSKKCLLSSDDVKLWLEHLSQVAENRRKGVEKAKATREKRNELLYFK